MTIETTAWDPAERLTSKEAITAYLEPVFEEGESHAHRGGPRRRRQARGMTEVARRPTLRGIPSTRR